MDKTDYILRSLSKISKKRWEHYAINRIFHLLNDLDIEFVCQQCIRKKDGKIYLADLFLPQLSMYLEIDEKHHDNEQAKIDDAVRRFDIAEATGFSEHRISASEVTIDSLNAEIDEFVQRVRDLKTANLIQGKFHGWDYENRFTAQSHITAGSLVVGPDAAFRYHKDALNCFGYHKTKGHHQSGSWDIPRDVCAALGLPEKCMVWFPRLYAHNDWDNTLSKTGKTIREINKDPQHNYSEKWDLRIVMAHSRDELNRTLYRFLGVFKFVPSHSTANKRIFKRIDIKVKTYKQQDIIAGNME